MSDKLLSEHLNALRSPGGEHALACDGEFLSCEGNGRKYSVINGTPHLYDAESVSPFLERDYSLFKNIHDRPDLRSPNHDAITAAYQSAKYVNTEFMFSGLEYDGINAKRVAEIGVGSADLIRRFADLGCSTYAIDYFTWEMEDGLAEHLTGGGRAFQCVSAAMCKLPFADQSLDLIYLHAALHHALPGDHRDFEWSNPHNMVDALREIRRVVRPDGAFFLLGEGIYPEGVDHGARQYERACEHNPGLPYESWYTISEYESAFRAAEIFPNLFV
jgi:SAM-dependent methyltransferase